MSLTQKPDFISQNVWEIVSNSPEYFHSHCRLEPLKRIVEIYEAFIANPDKILIITSGGPMQEWLKKRLEMDSPKNIFYLGRVTNPELVFIMQNATFGVMIPVDEDAGITQIEFLASGVPVIASNEGGLLETIIDQKTGFFVKTID
jgi:glycosyltransferase involved in cell wall biosynthesis